MVGAYWLLARISAAVLLVNMQLGQLPDMGSGLSSAVFLRTFIRIMNLIILYVLTVVVTESFLNELFESIEQDPQTEVEVNLPEQTVLNKKTGRKETFDINAYKKHCLMNGLDDIDFLLQNKEGIETWERNNK